MARTIVVCGYGPGVSDGVARKFGAQGFQVALVARSEDKVHAGARALGEAGVTAKAFACDLGDPAAVTALFGKIRSALGPITVLHWNAYVGLAGDLTTSDAADLRKSLDVSVVGLVTAIQSVLPDMKTQKDAAVLVTGGGFAFYDPKVDAMAVQYQAMGLAVAKAAQHKLTGVLSAKLASDGIYVGELVILGSVKGTAFDRGQATLDPTAIGERFWQLYEGRSEASVSYTG